ncbi:MAG: nitrogen fixation protein NifQ, partial [Pelovirga sp.]
VSSTHPRYRQLMKSSCAADIVAADRHLFACLLVIMEQEKSSPAIALGLSSQQFTGLCRHYFPAIEFGVDGSKDSSAVSSDPELLNLLLGYVSTTDEATSALSGTLLAQILAARAARPGHLWVAMGLFERAELGATIKRHLPTLFAANNQGMRWKRFFYKQICEQQGGMLCKSPVCGECSEYELCFG